MDHPGILRYRPRQDNAFVLTKLIDLQEALKLRESYLNPKNWSLGPGIPASRFPDDLAIDANTSGYENENFEPEIDYFLSSRRLLKSPPKSCIENLRCQKHQASAVPYSFSRISKVFLNYFGK